LAVEKYPAKILDELQTVQQLLDNGRSLARFGDGEVKLMDGASQIREPKNTSLGAELRATIAEADPRLLVGIPTMDSRGPKIRNWEARAPRFLKHLNPNVQYGSAFVSRPDSSPWIMTQEYANKVVDLWRKKRVTIICEEHSKLLTVLRKTCKEKLDWVKCPSHEAYKHISEYENYVLRGRSDIVVLSHGPSATCLARRLALQDRQCIDLGSVGGFLLKMLDLEPLGDLRAVVLKRPDDMTVDEMKAKLEADWTLRFFDEKER
jgi:hypothetical protein